MARPDPDQIEREERWSTTCGDLSSAIEAVGTIAAYIRMMVRREPRLMEFAEQADRYAAIAVDKIDQAKDNIQVELDGIQEQRSEQNRKKDDDG
jgi:hypothetical protein